MGNSWKHFIKVIKIFSVQAANTGQSETQGKHYEKWISYEDKQWY